MFFSSKPEPGASNQWLQPACACSINAMYWSDFMFRSCTGWNLNFSLVPQSSNFWSRLQMIIVRARPFIRFLFWCSVSSTFISREDDIVMKSLSSKSGFLILVVLAAVFSLAATQFGYERELGFAYGGIGRELASYGRSFGIHERGLGGYSRFSHGVYGWASNYFAVC